MSETEPRTESPAPVADDEPLRLPAGPIRRNAPLLLGVLVVLLVGPWISQLLKSYRGIVLDVRHEDMLVAWEVQPPSWLDAIDAHPGDIVVKEAGDWEPTVVPRSPADHDLVALFDRWMLTYKGTIVRIIAPTRPGGAHTAVIALDSDGRQIHVPLTASHLDGAAVGRRVEKTPGSWDPMLTNDPVAAPSPPPPAPSGSTPPANAEPVGEATLGD